MSHSDLIDRAVCARERGDKRAIAQLQWSDFDDAVDLADGLQDAVGDAQDAEPYMSDESFDHAFGTEVAWAVTCEDAQAVIAFHGVPEGAVMPTVQTEVSGGGCHADEYSRRHRCGPSCEEFTLDLDWQEVHRERRGDTTFIVFAGEPSA